MFYTLLVFLLLSAPFHSQKNQLYQLAPSIPPQAFVGEYYTCDFRVQGLENPSYKFTNLPSFLKASPVGRIEGIPSKKGSYTISVAFSQGKFFGETQLILSVCGSSEESKMKNDEWGGGLAKEIKNSAYYTYQHPFIPTLYNTGDYIFLNLAYYFGGSNSLWSYMKLPPNLKGTSEGSINGTLYEEGLYTFAAIRSDQNGKVQTLIVTLNIQSSYYYASWGGYPLENVPIRIRNTEEQTVQQIQSKAVNCVVEARAGLAVAQKRLDEIKSTIAKNAVTAALAQNTLNTQNEFKKLTQQKQTKLIIFVTAAKDKYDLAKRQYQQIETDYQNQRAIFDGETLKMRIIETNFNQFRENLQTANKAFIDAQNASFTAAHTISSLQVQIAGYREDAQTALTLVGSARQNLANYQNIHINSSFETSKAQIDKEIANMQNDIANSDLHSKQRILNKTVIELQKNNQNVIDIKEQLQTASSLLGQAKFNLVQATNQLLVAQAAKAEADRAMNIISQQLRSKLSSKTGPYIFNGCERGGYPSFSGSLIVSELIANGALLSSGHILLYGNCTKIIELKVGQLITFVGYLKDGVINSLQISN